VRVTVRVSPGAKQTRVVGRHGDGWKVCVTAPAEGGRANDAVVRLLAGALAIPAGGIRIVAGHAARTKVVEIDGLDRDAVDAALDRESSA
jgi:uncharacterized protein (TIGR00251 family)